MKEKRKKIVARVGAMVAAVLLVALCALPAFAEDDGYNDLVVGLFKECYEVASNSALGAILDSSGFDILKTPYVFSFTTPEVGSLFGLVSAATLGFTNIENKGLFAIAEKTENGAVYLYENVTLQTSFTTNSGNRYFYFDFHVDGVPVSPRVCRIRIKQSQTTFEILSCEIEGDIDGDAGDYEFAFASSKQNSAVLPYGFSRGLLVPSIDTNIYDFTKVYFGTHDDAYEEGVEHGKQLGYNDGYNDGMSQTSLIDGVTAIFRAPMEFINAVLNFEIFGINMAVAVRVLISMAILGMVITVIWKAVK